MLGFCEASELGKGVRLVGLWPTKKNLRGHRHLNHSLLGRIFRPSRYVWSLTVQTQRREGAAFLFAICDELEFLRNFDVIKGAIRVKERETVVLNREFALRRGHPFK